MTRYGIAGWLPLLFLTTELSAQPVQFNRDVRPILAANCFECHGADEESREADLRLDTADSAYADRDGVIAIAPGNPDASEIWARISSDDPDVVMPPPDSKKSLTDEERNLILQWIEDGAPYESHWAFTAPVRPDEPEVDNSAWVRNPIDRFILARLEREGLHPQPEADRETLIRRVAFALTGLPPTVSEVDAFLADSSPQAYEHMVDRYLHSQHYGEEQARHWLDVARYADTHGLHLDNEREMWAYRDWVVRAFNENLPFDEFTTWQLAGDLLPEPTLDQLVATGFNRCNVSTSEGGAIGEEWLYRYAVDRTSTTIQAWMGLTAGCAVCHDHKYDPLSMEEFYSLYSFFYSAADPAMDGNIRDTNPFTKVPTPAQAAELAAARERESAARRELDAALTDIEYSDPADDESAAETTQEIVQTIADDDFQYGTRVRNTSRNAVSWVLDPEFGAPSGRRVIEMAYGAQFDITVELALIPVVIPDDGHVDCRLRIDTYYPPHVFALRFDDGQRSRQVVWGDAEQLNGEFDTVEMGPVPEAGDWVRLDATFEQIGIEPGARLKNIVLIQNGGRVWLDDVRISGRTTPAADPLSSFQAWWTVSKGGNPGGISGELANLLKAGPGDDDAPEQREELLRFYLTHIQRISESPVPNLREAVQSAELEVAAIDATIPGTFTFSELSEPREAFVMLRGQYDKPGEPVTLDVPAVFPPLPEGEAERSGVSRPTRLDLARWLLSAEHPLTARVAVNRTWQQLFGIGLVRTSDDFGTRGELPSHPELLDSLAVDFRESGWNMQRLIRMILTSATFRQQSVVTPELYQRDPENRLLARGPRIRLSAEQLRDNALFVSGLINLEMGGRGVMPYQPPDIWEPVGYENSNTRFYQQDHGVALYRRSLYCFLKRTAPPPFMSNFDGPNREQFCARRERSNTPLQALQLMNDVQHFEAARALAERAIVEAGDGSSDRIDFLYRTVLSRLPTEKERELVQAAYVTQLDLFQHDPEAAVRTVNVGESEPVNAAPAPETAAWTMMANLVLNLDETITRN